ncbi:MAG: hypothetical protein H2069_06050 [Legionella sp.]|nr:hypothetical protein [Legionella sp.]
MKQKYLTGHECDPRDPLTFLQESSLQLEALCAKLDFKPTADFLNQLLLNQFTRGNSIEKFKDHEPYYSARVGITPRLMMIPAKRFRMNEHGLPQWELVLLPIKYLPTHDYTGFFQSVGPDSIPSYLKDHNDLLYSMGIRVIQSEQGILSVKRPPNLSFEKDIRPKVAHVSKKKYRPSAKVQLSSEQEVIINSIHKMGQEKTLLYVLGIAGAGKSTAAREALKSICNSAQESDQAVRIIYVAPSKKLVDHFSRSCGSIDLPQNVKFIGLTVEDLLNKCDETADWSVKVGFPEFEQWCANATYKNQEQIKKEDRPLLYREFQMRGAYLEESNYVEGGLREKILTGHTKQDLSALYEQYTEFLTNNCMIDINLCQPNFKKFDIKEKKFFMFDEAQNIPPAIISTVAKDYFDERTIDAGVGGMLVLGDFNQSDAQHTTLPSFEILESNIAYLRLKENSSANVKREILSTNFRNSQSVFLLLKLFANLGFELTGGTQSKTQLPVTFSSKSSELGQVEYIEDVKRLDKLFDAVIIVPDETFKKESPKELPYPTLTVQEAQGLEFETVILFGFTKKLAEIGSLLKPYLRDEALFESLMEDNVYNRASKENLIEIQQKIGSITKALFVGISRGMRDVLIYEGSLPQKDKRIPNFWKTACQKVMVKATAAYNTVAEPKETILSKVEATKTKGKVQTSNIVEEQKSSDVEFQFSQQTQGPLNQAVHAREQIDGLLMNSALNNELLNYVKANQPFLPSFDLKQYISINRLQPILQGLKEELFPKNQSITTEKYSESAIKKRLAIQQTLTALNTIESALESSSNGLSPIVASNNFKNLITQLMIALADIAIDDPRWLPMLEETLKIVEKHTDYFEISLEDFSTDQDRMQFSQLIDNIVKNQKGKPVVTSLQAFKNYLYPAQPLLAEKIEIILDEKYAKAKNEVSNKLSKNNNIATIKTFENAKKLLTPMQLQHLITANISDKSTGTELPIFIIVCRKQNYNLIEFCIDVFKKDNALDKLANCEAQGAQTILQCLIAEDLPYAVKLLLNSMSYHSKLALDPVIFKQATEDRFKDKMLRIILESFKKTEDAKKYDPVEIMTLISKKSKESKSAIEYALNAYNIEAFAALLELCASTGQPINPIFVKKIDDKGLTLTHLVSRKQLAPQCFYSLLSLSENPVELLYPSTEDGEKPLRCFTNSKKGTLSVSKVYDFIQEFMNKPMISKVAFALLSAKAPVNSSEESIGATVFQKLMEFPESLKDFWTCFLKVCKNELQDLLSQQNALGETALHVLMRNDCKQSMADSLINLLFNYSNDLTLQLLTRKNNAGATPMMVADRPGGEAFINALFPRVQDVSTNIALKLTWNYEEVTTSYFRAFVRLYLIDDEQHPQKFASVLECASKQQLESKDPQNMNILDHALDTYLRHLPKAVEIMTMHKKFEAVLDIYLKENVHPSNLESLLNRTMTILKGVSAYDLLSNFEEKTDPFETDYECVNNLVQLIKKAVSDPQSLTDINFSQVLRKYYQNDSIGLLRVLTRRFNFTRIAVEEKTLADTLAQGTTQQSPKHSAIGYGNLFHYLLSKNVASELAPEKHQELISHVVNDLLSLYAEIMETGPLIEKKQSPILAKERYYPAPVPYHLIHYSYSNALEIAIDQENIALVKIFLQNLSPNELKQTLLMNSDQYSRNELTFAFQKGNVDVLDAFFTAYEKNNIPYIQEPVSKYVLIKYDQIISFSPAFEAIFQKNLPLLKLLLQKGIDLDEKKTELMKHWSYLLVYSKEWNPEVKPSYDFGNKHTYSLLNWAETMRLENLANNEPSAFTCMRIIDLLKEARAQVNEEPLASSSKSQTLSSMSTLFPSNDIKVNAHENAVPENVISQTELPKGP